MTTDLKKIKDKVYSGLLEEDDEFEEFPAEGNLNNLFLFYFLI